MIPKFMEIIQYWCGFRLGTLPLSPISQSPPCWVFHFVLTTHIVVQQSSRTSEVALQPSPNWSQLSPQLFWEIPLIQHYVPVEVQSPKTNYQLNVTVSILKRAITGVFQLNKCNNVCLSRLYFMRFQVEISFEDIKPFRQKHAIKEGIRAQNL